jgi:hypothetical protein
MFETTGLPTGWAARCNRMDEVRRERPSSAPHLPGYLYYRETGRPPLAQQLRTLSHCVVQWDGSKIEAWVLATHALPTAGRGLFLKKTAAL